MRNSQSFFFLTHTNICTAQSNTKKLKIVTCMAHLLRCGLGINSRFISHLSPSSESVGMSNNYTTMLVGSQDTPGVRGCWGRFRCRGALPQGPLPTPLTVLSGPAHLQVLGFPC